MIRSFKDKGLRGHLGGKIKQELVLSKLGTIRYRTASGSDRPVVSSDFFNNERAGRYRSRFCNDKLLLARTTQSHFDKDWLTLAFADNNPSRYGRLKSLP